MDAILQVAPDGSDLEPRWPLTKKDPKFGQLSNGLGILFGAITLGQNELNRSIIDSGWTPTGFDQT